MSLRVLCGSCKKTVKAPEHLAGTVGKCPGCGAAITIPAVAVNPPATNVLTIEATSKQWKTIQLVGGAGIVLAILTMGFDVRSAILYSEPGYPLSWLTLGLLMLSIPVWIVGRIGAWWFHG